MNYENWSWHLDRITEFRNSEIFDICCQDENIVTELFYGYISAIGEDQVCDLVGNIYYGENSNFWVDYLIEDFIKYGEAIVPRIIKDNRDIDEIESELDYGFGIPLTTDKELYDFITNGKLPDREIKYISPYMAIRRNS